MASSPTYLGTVQDVQGATVSVALDQKTVSGLAFIDGHGYRIGQIGSFVRISIGFNDLFGIVSQVGAGAVPEALAKLEPYGNRWLRVQLIGEAQRSGGFHRGSPSTRPLVTRRISSASRIWPGSTAAKTLRTT
jgi:hypothetical protein